MIGEELARWLSEQRVPEGLPVRDEHGEVEAEIIFRRIGDPVPSHWMADLHWYVEYHAAAWESAPAGVAFVVSGPVMCVLEYVHVVDTWRRSGVATALVNACRQAWPHIYITEGKSDSGRAFRASLNPGRRQCRKCGCTDEDCRQCIEATGQPCHWVSDELCSACA